MKAITLWRPWPWAIFFAGKDIENRTWEPPKGLIGQRLAIHAGKRFDPEAVAYLQELGFECPERPDDHPLGLVGTVTYSGAVRSSTSEWFEGSVGWQLADPHKLEIPLEVSGKQGLWPVPDELARLLF